MMPLAPLQSLTYPAEGPAYQDAAQGSEEGEGGRMGLEDRRKAVRGRERGK
jgi:hypothetical protein